MQFFCASCKVFDDVYFSYFSLTFITLKYYLLSLQEEVILKILKNLDMKSLCSMNRVNKHLNILTRDPLLFTSLNLRNMCDKELRNINFFRNYNIMLYFTTRCKYLQQLDLTRSDFLIDHFVEFLNICGSGLTHLRLHFCKFVNDVALLQISKICKKLKGI